MNKNLVLTLQPMPLPQATEHPNWGRFAEDRSHAVFCIVECLNRVGLTEWVPQFIKWLGKYDGLEMYADDEDDPQLCVRKIVRKNLAHFLKYYSKNSFFIERTGELVEYLIALHEYGNH